MKNRKIVSAILAVTMLISLCACDKKESTTIEMSDNIPPSQVETDAEATKTETPEIEGYNLLWSDEFDGDAMDESKWNYEPHEPGWVNNELQEYTTSTDNVFVRDGKLVLKAIKTEKDGKESDVAWATSSRALASAVAVICGPPSIRAISMSRDSPSRWVAVATVRPEASSCFSMRQC